MTVPFVISKIRPSLMMRGVHYDGMNFTVSSSHYYYHDDYL